MKQTDIHFWSYLVHFFLESKMFQTKVVNEIKTHILCLITFFLKSYCLWDIVKKNGTAWQTTDDNIIGHMLIACWIPKCTNLHSEYVIIIAFTLEQWLHQRASVLPHAYFACLVDVRYEATSGRKNTSKNKSCSVLSMNARMVKQRYSSTHFQLQRYMGVSGKLHTPAPLSPGLKPCTFWAPEVVSTCLEMTKYPTPTETSTPFRPSRSRVTIPIELTRPLKGTKNG